MQNRKLKIGIIGCGKVAHTHHLPSLKAIQLAEVIALADTNSVHLNKLADDYSIENRYNTIAELLSNNEIEAVGILTPTHSHAALALTALRAGKHVFLEKPLSSSKEDCHKLVEAGRQSNLTTMTCFNLRWHRHVLRAKEMISSGQIGDIKAIVSTFTHNRDGANAPDWHRYLDLGGGVTLNEGVHHFDLWRFLLNQEISCVSSFQTDSNYYEDETNVISARLSGGTLATLVMTLQSHATCEIEIIGTKGRLCLNLYQFDGFKFYHRSTYPGALSMRAKELYDTITQFGTSISALKNGGVFKEIFYFTWSHFIDCILNGKKTSCDFVAGQQAVLASLAAIQSFTESEIIHLNNVN